MVHLLDRGLTNAASVQNGGPKMKTPARPVFDARA